MSNRRAQVWILKRLFDGEPKLSDFQLEQQTLRDLNDGGIKRQIIHSNTKSAQFILPRANLRC